MSHFKVLAVDQYKDIGGGQTIYLNVIIVLLEAQFKITAMFPHGGELEKKINGLFSEQIRTVNVNELPLSQGKKTALDVLKIIKYLVYFFNFAHYIKNNDVIYINGPRFYFPFFILSFFIKKKYIYHIHLNHSTFVKYFLRLLESAPSTYKIIVNSYFVYTELYKLFPFFRPSRKVIVLENPLSRRLSQLCFIDRFKVTPKKYNVAIIGRICEQKGQDVLLELAPKFPYIDFYVIGSADFSNKVFLQTLKCKASPNVIFFGKSSDLFHTLNHIPIHISLVPSKWAEPFGLVAIESMACSCLTVTSNTGELPNISKNTSSFIYSSFESLVETLDKITSSSSSELSRIAFTQNSKTLKFYNFSLFKDKLLSLILCD